jgi:hypothetical protein
VGVAGENLGATGNAGAVNILYGTASGLTGTGSRLFTQDSPGVPGGSEPGDGFGETLAIGDFDGDGFADLAVGVTLEDLGAIVDAGAVNVLYGTTGGLTGTGSQLFTQDSPGVGSSAEGEDAFGGTIAADDFDGDDFADLAVGVWRENVGAAANGGAVNVLYGTTGGLTGNGSQFFTQDSPGVSGVVEPDDEVGLALGAGDFNRDRFLDLAVGAPGEDYGAADRGGAVNLLFGSAGGLTGTGSQLLTQNSPGCPGWPSSATTSAPPLPLATSMATAPLTWPPEWQGVGHPRRRCGRRPPRLGRGADRVGSQLFSQDSPGVPDSAEFRDGFGSALAAGAFDADSFVDLAVGVLGETVDSFEFAGAVNVLPGSADGLTGSGSQLFTQDSPGVPGGVEFDDFFGGALAASGP